MLLFAINAIIIYLLPPSSSQFSLSLQVMFYSLHYTFRAVSPNNIYFQECERIGCRDLQFQKVSALHKLCAKYLQEAELCSPAGQLLDLAPFVTARSPRRRQEEPDGSASCLQSSAHRGSPDCGVLPLPGPVPLPRLHQTGSLLWLLLPPAALLSADPDPERPTGPHPSGHSQQH